MHFIQTRSFLRGTERGLIMSAQSPQIEPQHIVLGAGVSDLRPNEIGIDDFKVVLRFAEEPTLEALRAEYLQLLFARYGGNRRKVASVLGISERNTYRLIRKLDKVE